MKTELLVQMDGISSKGGKKKKGALPPQVFVMAASNMPWDLDVAGEHHVHHSHHMHHMACIRTHTMRHILPLTLTPHLPPPSAAAAGKTRTSAAATRRGARADAPQPPRRPCGGGRGRGWSVF